MPHHPTAVIHPATRIDESATIGPYAVIEDGVEIGPQCLIGPHAVIQAGTVLGEGCQVFAQAVIGGPPQDLAFDPRTPSGVVLEPGVVVREGVTIHRATRAGQFTTVAAGALLMAYSHVAHDCTIGAHAILANNVMLGGFVQVGAHAFLGGGAAVHQKARVGESAMVSGLSRISRDVPPYCLVAERDALSGLNLVGLKRRGFDREDIAALKQAYRLVYFDAGNPRAYARAAEKEGFGKSPLAARFLAFFAEGQRGFVQPGKFHREGA